MSNNCEFLFFIFLLFAINKKKTKNKIKIYFKKITHRQNFVLSILPNNNTKKKGLETVEPISLYDSSKSDNESIEQQWQHDIIAETG